MFHAQSKTINHIMGVQLSVHPMATFLLIMLACKAGAFGWFGNGPFCHPAFRPFLSDRRVETCNHEFPEVPLGVWNQVCS